jgi:hypothetical protein
MESLEVAVHIFVVGEAALVDLDRHTAEPSAQQPHQVAGK